MTTYESQDWTQAHTAVNEFLSQLLNTIRDAGYNPSHHIAYDRQEHHLELDPVLINKHAEIKRLYHLYLDACLHRDLAVERIQKLPKMDLGFEQQ